VSLATIHIYLKNVPLKTVAEFDMESKAPFSTNILRKFGGQNGPERRKGIERRKIKN
jgi:hypothetical protein